MSAEPASPRMIAAALRAANLDWIVPDWPAPPNVGALVTTRTGGVSAGAYATMNLGRRSGDDAAAIAANRRRFESFLPAAPVWLEQVHGATVAVVDRALPAGHVPVADAAVTRERGVVCAVQVADCLPVLVADRGGTAVGVAHAGWRGLAAGVIEATVGALRAFGIAPGELVAWLGPAIGATAFEVGADARDAFCRADPGAAAAFAAIRDGKWHADLPGLARRRLAQCGVTRVDGGGFCTFNDRTRFYSYRRERETGRMAAAIWLAG